MPKKVTIKSWKSVDEAMARMGEIAKLIAAAENNITPQIEALTKELENQIAPLKAEYEELELAIKSYAVDHQGEFGSIRSKEMLNGTVSLRSTCNIEYLNGESNTLDLLKQLGFTHCIKTKETIVKATLTAMTPDTLRTVGATAIKGTSATIKLK